ncbi:MAG: hypothetical protein WC389_19090, partial [Lutibacter sp.]
MPKKKNDLELEPTQELDQELDKELKKIEKKSFKSLIDQIDAEYQLAWWFMKPKLDAWAIRLKLYNNQKREAEAIG